MTAKNLYEQQGDVQRDAAAILCGMQAASPEFDFTLRSLPPLPEGHTIGDVARAYLRVKLADLERIGAEHDTDRTSEITIQFTPMEKEAVLHRLDEWDIIEQVFMDTDGLEHVAIGAADRARTLALALNADPDGILRINGTEQDEEIVCEAIAGSTWNAVHDNTEVSTQKQAAARRALESAAAKIEAALGKEPGHIDIPGG